MTRLGRLLAGLAVLALISVPSAHATTYQFSFTTTQLLNALVASGASGAANQNDSATFAIFLDATSAGTVSNPTQTTLTYGSGANGYTYGSETIPVQSGGTTADDWQAGVDSGSPFSGTAPDLYFGKTASQGSVSVVANSTAWAMTSPYTMDGFYYTGDGSTNTPYMWGSTAGTVINNLASGAGSTFTFTLVSNAITAGELVTFSGQASQLKLCPSTTTDNTFTLQLTAVSAVPEPNTIMLLGLGAACLLAGVVRKRAKKSPVV